MTFTADGLGDVLNEQKNLVRVKSDPNTDDCTETKARLDAGLAMASGILT